MRRMGPAIRYRLQSNPGSSPVDPSFRLTTLAMTSASDLKRPRKGKDAESSPDETQKLSDPKETLVIHGLRVDDLEFTNAGLLVRKKAIDDRVNAAGEGEVDGKEKASEGEQEGWLVLLNKFAWVEKAKIASAASTA